MLDGSFSHFSLSGNLGCSGVKTLGWGEPVVEHDFSAIFAVENLEGEFLVLNVESYVLKKLKYGYVGRF